ncbi:hypothetical protein [Candidatus Berkiella aquae]|uniref:Uncharacterized protein n=1 Tax=Candidatus Berkiella aquae TaxID=295108 RepID=A0A0Q9YLV7_9GAMM|nr:hypothetical protein [Candidatus Berkiella aquae]MCS5711678.1 hypothetical protein [Candidatus Berkiella aquae]
MSQLAEQLKNYQNNLYKLEIFTTDDKTYNFDKGWSITETDDVSWAIHNDKNETITYVNLANAVSFVLKK